MQRALHIRVSVSYRYCCSRRRDRTAKFIEELSESVSPASSAYYKEIASRGLVRPFHLKTHHY
jgi:hypothetical protein